MKKLVVLVGLPGSGKTAYQEKQSDWAVVSRDVIRQSVFKCSFESAFEDAVDRIFASAVLEAMESSAQTVCIDDLNLLRKDRRSYVEWARMTEREAVAVVMPYDPADSIYQLAQQRLETLREGSPQIRVASFPRDRFDAMLRCYEAVRPEEGFSEIVRVEDLPQRQAEASRLVPARRERRRQRDSKNAIPLFAA
jgi:predicted kinase